MYPIQNDFPAVQNENQAAFRSIPKGFVACPFALLCGMSPEQIQWQQAIYEKAYAQAQWEAGIQKIVWDLPFEARN